MTITASQNLGPGTYNNLTIDGVDITATLTGSVTINGILTLTNGIIITSSSNLLVLGASARLSGGNTTSYINGPVAVTWPATGTKVTMTFPIGKANKYRPLTMKLDTASSQVILGEVFIGNCGGVAGPGLAAISSHLFFTTIVTSGVAGTGIALLGYMNEDSVNDSKSIRVARSTTINGVYENIGGSGLYFASGSAPGEVMSGTYTIGNTTEFLVHATTDSVKNPLSDVESSGNVPLQFGLEQNYPNPFNPSTTISFSLSHQSFISLKVFNLIGREVATIESGEMPAGNYTRIWNATNISSGIYFCRLQADTYTETKKLVLLK